MTKKISIFVVRGGNSGEPESYVLGAYPTVALAKNRIDMIKREDGGFEDMWYDEIKVGPEGGDCFLANR